jgi:cytochrome c peroxidase
MRRRVLSSGLVLGALACSVLAGAGGERAKAPDDLPRGVSAALYRITVPASAAPTKEKVALGDKLFNDKRLSVDDTVSCATCHDPARGFVDHKPQSEGIGSHRGTRNSPTVVNAMFNATQFWDGRAATLEDQAKLPILNPIEMGQRSPEDVVKKVRGIPEYVSEFRAVFGRDVSYDDLAAAIAAFERTHFSGDSPFDRFLAGEVDAIDASAKRGWSIFNGKGRCTDCHAFSTTSPLFSDQKFHNIGIAAHKTDFIALAGKGVAMVRSGDLEQIDHLALETDLSELGRFLVTKNLSDVGTFKTPNLRNIAATGPYMHDGSLATLWDVMDHYNKGGVPNPYLDGGMQRLGLSEDEIDDTVAFLATLTSPEFQAFGEQEMATQRSHKDTRPERDTDVAMGRKGNLGDIAPNPDLKNPADLGALPPIPLPVPGA